MASKTRDIILETALRMFNEEGLSQVSTNRIAIEMGISPGNLHYHFKGKLQIVEWLFRRFASGLAPFDASYGAVNALDDLWLTLHLSFELTEKYRFLFLETEHIAREFPAVMDRLSQLARSAKRNAVQMCERMRVAGILDIEADEIEGLALQVVMTTTCWFGFSRLLRSEKSVPQSARMAAYQVLTLMLPFVRGEHRAYLDFLRRKYDEA